ncbi:MAG: Uma2 family endonuclease [Spirochaetes bacterium]|nr:Uma2 family endonuclease [Spirochaetota bacterium]
MPLARKQKKLFTYADYLRWDDSIRVELIGGEVYDMTPAPSLKHQELLTELVLIFGNFLKGKKCRLFPAPFDVRLPDKGAADRDITTVVQPDISIICDPKKLDQRGCLGAPDMVVEILSPETATKDMREKLALYEKHGVKEYWIIHPLDKTVLVFTTGKNSAYGKPSTYSPPDKVKVKSLKGLVVELSALFRE